MANESNVIVQACCVITVACSLGAASLLIKKRKKELHMGMKMYIRGRQQNGECNTLLPELAATEVVKCVHYIRMDIEI